MNELISVIVTTFNRKKYLIETVKSILNQTYTNIEIIIVDDFSDYNVINEVSLLRDIRINVFQNKSFGAVANNRNFGINVSKGKFIAFCDDDDIWESDKLEIQINRIKNYDFCFTNRSIINSNGDTLNSRKIKIKKNITVFDILYSNKITLSSVLIKKDIFYNFDAFDNRKEYIATEDYELWLRLLAKKKLALGIDKPTVKYRVHNNNISANKKESFKKILQINKNLNSELNISFIQKQLICILNNFKIFYYTLKMIKL